MLRCLRLPLPPGRDGDHDRQLLAVARLELEALPGIDRLGPVVPGMAELGHLLLEPALAARRIELGLEPPIDGPEMGHVAQSISELLRRQRPAAPVGEARSLVDLGAGKLAGQHLVACLIAETADHGRDLGVEQRRRDDPGARIHDLDVLAGGVEHLDHPRIHHELPERLQLELRCQRIDDRLVLRASDLNEAQLGPIGLLSHELRVHGHEGFLGELRAETLEGLR